MPRAFILPKSAEPQTLDEILGWHGAVVGALLEQLASVQSALRAGSVISPRFVGKTGAEVELDYRAHQRELDRLTVLNLVASAEATIRIDYLRRVKLRRKDPLAVAYRKWHRTLSKKKKELPDFDEKGILEVLKRANVLDNNLIGQYRVCLRARHWLGHGRYWAKPAEVDQLGPEDVYDRADALLRALPI